MSAAILQLDQRRGRKRIADGRRKFDLFPTGSGQSGVWLYALGLPDGRVKVGIARRPRSRVGQHWSTHQGIVWAHLFRRLPTHGQAKHAEVYCLSAASKLAARVGRTEYFLGADPRTFVAACRNGIEAYLKDHPLKVAAQPQPVEA